MFTPNTLFNNIVTLSPVAAVSTGATALLTETQAATPGLRAVVIQPVGGDIYIGDSGVTTSNGIKITDGSLTMWPKTRAVIYAISAGSVNTRVMLGGE